MPFGLLPFAIPINRVEFKPWTQGGNLCPRTRHLLYFIMSALVDQASTSSPVLRCKDRAVETIDSGKLQVNAETTWSDEIPAIVIKNMEDDPEPPISGLPMLSHSLKAQRFEPNSWDAVSFFDSSARATPARRARSCDGHLESFPPRPVSSTESQRVPLPTTPRIKPSRNNLTSNRSSAGTKGDSIEVESESPRTPGSPDSELSDSDVPVFGTPQKGPSRPFETFTPPTPRSAYDDSKGWLGVDRVSPTSRRQRRPTPAPLQKLHHEPEIKLESGESAEKLDHTSTGSTNTGDRSRSRERLPNQEKINPGEGGVETKIEETAENSHDTQHNDFPADSSARRQSIPPDPLVKGVDILNDVLGSNILDWFGEKSTRCIGPNQNGERCKRQIKEVNAEHARIELQRLQEILPLRDCITTLTSLAALIFCGNDHRKVAEKRVGAWLTQHHMAATLVHEVVQDLSKAAQNAPVDPSCGSSLFNGLRVHKNEDTNPAHPTCNFKFNIPSMKQCKSWQPKSTLKLSTLEALIRCAAEPLTKHEKPGYLYVYSTPGDFGLRKIGITKYKDVQKRLNEWEKKCNRPPIIVYPIEERDNVLVPHVKRLEKLIHRELKDYQLQEQSCSCRKLHKEWFDTRDNHIIAVVRRWTTWMQQQPYESYAGVWLLRRGLEDLVADCMPWKALDAEACAVPARNKSVVIFKRQSARLTQQRLKRSSTLATDKRQVNSV